MPDKDKVLSKDPFNLYDILNKRKDSGEDLKYPPGLTPSVINMEEVNKKVKGATSNEVNEHVNSTSNKLEEFVLKRKLSSNNSVCLKRVHTGGSILQLMDELVKGILCVWEPTLFVKDKVTSSDNFLTVIDRWDGNCVIMGNFNEVRMEQERYCSVFNVPGANAFNSFIILASLIDLTLDGHAYTWAYKTANKMSKLDRFLVSKGLLASFLYLSALYLDTNLSNHHHVLMRELRIDYGPTPVRFFHSWFNLDGFDKMIEDTWKSLATVDSNGIINLKKKLQALKICGSNEEILSDRSLLLKELNDINSVNSLEAAQKSKLFMRPLLMASGWFDLLAVKSVFLKYFSTQFSLPVSYRICFANQFTNRYWKLLEHDIVITIKEFFALGLFSGIPIDRSLTLTHIFFADDAIFVGKWDSLNICTTVNVLKCSHLASGLKINFHKSKLMGISTRPKEVDAAATTMGCLIYTTPFVHLGVKVRGAMSRIKSWDDVVSKVSSRLSKWKLKTLLIGGRLTLIKSVLTTIPLYHMSIFKVPSGLLQLLDSIRTNFFNGLDGFIKAIYGEDSALNSPSALSKRSPWLDIICEVTVLGIKGINLLDLIRKKVGNGLNTLLWEVPWLDDLAGGDEEEQLDIILSRMDGLILTNIPDRRVWSLEAIGKFSDKYVRQLIDDSILPKEEVATRWVKAMPIKINVFAWRVRLDKLHTWLNLSLKGIDISTIVCPLCHASVESGSHIFFSYPMAHHLWRKCMRWRELEDIDLASYDDWLLWLNSFRLSKWQKEILENVCYVKWWLIWRFIN
ncbi:RNA-directed DNA polymerase, eukaryota [Tanacetum coccineum]